MIHRTIIWLFLFGCSCYVFGQNTKQPFSYSAQLGITDATMFDQLLTVIPGIGRPKSNTLIQRQNIKSYMMPVRHLESNGNVLAYSVATCLEYYINLNRNYKVNLSPDYLALNLKNAGQKVAPSTIFQHLVQDGTVSAAILPYGAQQLTAGVYATQKYRIKNYLHLFRDITRGRQRVFETRNALLKGHPVLIELVADSDFAKIHDEHYWEPPKSPSQSFPLVIVGYDEVAEAFEATSCWGNQWGENGYIWIHYADFETYAKNGYVMLLK